MIKCTGGQIIDQQCLHRASWRNMNGVEVCEHHKRLLDAFTWEGRNERRWERINMSWLDDLIMKKADNLRNVPED